MTLVFFQYLKSMHDFVMYLQRSTLRTMGPSSGCEASNLDDIPYMIAPQPIAHCHIDLIPLPEFNFPLKSQSGALKLNVDGNLTGGMSLDTLRSSSATVRISGRYVANSQD